MPTKLTRYCVPFSELQSYLDKYGKDIKFILPLIQTDIWRNSFCLIIEEKE